MTAIDGYVAAKIRDVDGTSYDVMSYPGLAGPAGPEGPTGATGVDGPQGSAGVFSPSGATGQILTANASGSPVWATHTGWSVFNLVLEPTWEIWLGETTAAIFYNSFVCTVSMQLHKYSPWTENTDLTFVQASNIRSDLMPARTLADARESIESGGWLGAHFITKFDPGLGMQVHMQGITPDWGQNTYVPFSFTYPRGALW